MFYQAIPYGFNARSTALAWNPPFAPAADRAENDGRDTHRARPAVLFLWSIQTL